MTQSTPINQHQIDFCWDGYKEQQEWRRHHENLRSSATNIVLTVASAISAFILYDQTLNFYDVPLSVFVIFVGYVGAQLCDRHYERSQHHAAKADAIMAFVYSHAPGYCPNDAITDALKQHDRKVADWASKRPRLLRGGLDEFAWRLWLKIHLVIMVFGGLLLLLSIIGGFYLG